MWQTKNEMNFDIMKWKMLWYEEDLECIMKLTEIPTHFEIQQIIMSWADERVEDEGCEMNNEWHKQAGWKF